MKALRLLLIAVVVYIGIVVVFESLLGVFQPQNESTLVLTVTDDQGNENDRVLARLDSNGELFVAVNHWPRAWYRKALQNPDVQVTIDGERRDYRAIAASKPEHQRLLAEHPHNLAFKFLTGFPPRYFVRLEPR